MVYQIQITPSKQGEFVQIIESLQKLGVIKQFRRSESYVTPGEPIEIGDLMQTLEESEKQIAEGLSFSPASAKVFIKAWQQRKK
jgi:hypothetical protein